MKSLDPPKEASALRRGYAVFCKGELLFSAFLFMVIVVLSFFAAITRKLGFPIQWTMDVSQLCFAWLAFLSGDIALRNGALPGVDMAVKKFPKKVQVILGIVCKILMLCLLVFFIYYGTILVFSNLSRSFQTLPIPYAFVSASLPVCSVLMVISILMGFHKDLENWKEV